MFAKYKLELYFRIFLLRFLYWPMEWCWLVIAKIMGAVVLCSFSNKHSEMATSWRWNCWNWNGCDF